MSRPIVSPEAPYNSPVASIRFARIGPPCVKTERRIEAARRLDFLSIITRNPRTQRERPRDEQEQTDTRAQL